jgi:hypothetical protein
MTIKISKKIENGLLASKKVSTVEIYKRQLKCMGLTEITEYNLNGKIKKIVDDFMKMEYKNPKAYINALLNVYQLCNYEPDELEYLKNEFTDICKICDTQRMNNTETTDKKDFTCNWNEIQLKYLKAKEKYENKPNQYNLISWFIASLYSDDNFGVKRTIDIINLKKSNIVENKIFLVTEKNKFNYESKELSERILTPLNKIIENIDNNNSYLITTTNNRKYTTNNFLYRLKEIFGNVDSQMLRRLWASYQYSKHPAPKELLRHAYELNHSIEIHLNDYVTEYNEDIINWGDSYKFRKITKWVRVKKA